MDDRAPSLELLASRLGTEWARKVRETFRSLRARPPSVWPGTRAGARSLVERICGSPDQAEWLTSLVEKRADLAWRRIRRFSGDCVADEPDE